MRYCEVGVTSLIHARVLPAAVVAIAFAVIARIMGSVSDGGALAGIAIAFCLIATVGFQGFVVLLTVFLLTAIATRVGYRHKLDLGLADRERGRTAVQVFANLGAAVICALPVLWFPQFRDVLLVGSMAALAEAAADTVSSEIGQAWAKHAYMITDFRNATIGTNGAISIEGTLSGCIAASLVAWASVLVGVVNRHWSPVITIAAIGGMAFDSILGATLENRGKVGNHAVNFVSTVFAADLALIVAMVVERTAS
jgi:uncharacterized protein (TIGR00297 family)